MDEDISRWVMEFLLQHSQSNELINKVLMTVPLPSISNTNFRFNKTLRLRYIQNEISDGLVSETILDTLKAIEVLDRKEGIQISSSMKTAYCAVAVECTVKYLGESLDKSSEYFEAVKRIWREKVGNLKETELATEELYEWREDIEAAIWGAADVRDKLLKKSTRIDASQLVRAYLEETWASMGPSVLELAAADTRLLEEIEQKEVLDCDDGVDSAATLAVKMSKLKVQKSNGGEVEEQSVSLVKEKASACDDVAEKAVVGKQKDTGAVTLAAAKMSQLQDQESVGGELTEHMANLLKEKALVIDDVAAAEKTVVAKQKGIEDSVLPKRKHMSCHRRARGPVRINRSEEFGTDALRSKYDTLPSPVVKKVQEALKSSSLDLRSVVTDPLPDALRKAEAVIYDMARKKQNEELSAGNQNVIDIHVPNQELPVEKHNGAGKYVPNPSVNASAGPVQADEGNLRNQPCRYQNNVPKPSLMEKNDTAHTYEWDDSIDGSPEGQSNYQNRFHLPSPNRQTVSPLKKHEITKFSRRRKLKRWSLEEEEALRNGVQEFGRRWKNILISNPEVFAERSEVDLKDKWRNMTR